MTTDLAPGQTLPGPLSLGGMGATATADDRMHLAALVNMAYGFAYVQTADGYLGSLGRGE